VESHDRNADDVEIENEPVANGVIRHEEEGSFLNDPQAENNNNNNNNNNNTQDERENSNNTSRDGVHSFVARPTMTLAELEEEVGQSEWVLDITTHSTMILRFTAGNCSATIISLFPIRSIYSISHVDLCTGNFGYVIDCSSLGTFFLRSVI
jgi:hypothetical protein